MVQSCMVVKRDVFSVIRILWFENGAILYGGKTVIQNPIINPKFENGAILYGGKTSIAALTDIGMFENGAILYGGKT